MHKARARLKEVQQQLVQAVAAKYPSSAGEWDVEQELEDPKDLVEVS